MKKTILFAVMLLSMSSSVFAVTLVNYSTGVDLSGTTFKPSQNVTIAVVSTTTAYSLASKHLAGDAVYTTDSVETLITEITDKPKGQAVTTTSGSTAAPSS